MTRRVAITNLEDPNGHRQIVVSTYTPDMAVQGVVEVVNPGRETVLTVHPNQVIVISDRMPGQSSEPKAKAEAEPADDSAAPVDHSAAPVDHSAAPAVNEATPKRDTPIEESEVD